MGALIIRYGDPAMANAIVSGMERADEMHAMVQAEIIQQREAELTNAQNQLAEMRAEMEQMRREQAALGVTVVRNARYWQEQIEEADRMYGHLKPENKFVTWLTIFIAMAWNLYVEGYEWLLSEMRKGTPCARRNA